MIPASLRHRWRAEGFLGEETLPQRLARVCAAGGERVALLDGEVAIGFARAAAMIERVAGWIATMIDGPGEVVSWQLPNWWEAAILHHATLRAGALPNPLPTAMREHELRFVVEQARPSVLVIPHEHRGFDHLSLARALQADAGIRSVVLVRARPQPRTFSFDHMLGQAAPKPLPPVPSDPGSLALLLYTSGTTSEPKGVQHTHEALLCEIDSFREIHGLTAEDRNLGGAPLGHIAGLMYGVLTPFALGTSTALLERWDAKRALALIEDARCTFMTGPPTFLQSLGERAGDAGHDTSSFRLFSTGGAQIPADAVRDAGARLGCVVKRAYGSTELPTLTATRLDDDEDARLRTDGRAIGGAQVRIVRTDGSDAPPGGEGEILGRSPEMFAGYRDAALPAFDTDGWFHTGDLGTIDERGLLRVTGRIKDIIIRGGENVSAAELEEMLAAHPAIAEVAIVGAPDERLGERICAFVVARAPLDLDDVVAFLTDRGLAKNKLPERLEIRDSLPHTESGKVRKPDLRAELQR